MLRLSMIMLLAVARLSVGVTMPGQAPPELNYTPTVGFLSLPEGYNFGEVTGVALNSRGHLLVFHRGQNPLLEFDSTGQFLREIGSGLFVSAHGLRIDNEDNIWTTDIGSHVVLKLSPDGQVLMVFGKWGYPGEGMFDNDFNVPLFNQPTDVAFDSRGNIYVSDGYGNARIVKFDSNGRLLTTWGTKGSDPGQFNLPHTIVIDAQDRIYVGDRENKRVQIFDTEGTFLAEWSHLGYPYGLTIDTNQILYIADARAERILKLDLKGNILGTFGVPGKSPGEFGWAHWIAIDPVGRLYVAEVLNWRVQRLDPR